MGCYFNTDGNPHRPPASLGFYFLEFKGPMYLRTLPFPDLFLFSKWVET